MDITDFLPDFNLRRGAGKMPENGLCFMEVVALAAGEMISGSPTCACPMITSVAISFNDRFDDEQRKKLLPLVLMTVGTRSPDHVDARRKIIWLTVCDMLDIMALTFRERKVQASGSAASAAAAAAAYAAATAAAADAADATYAVAAYAASAAAAAAAAAADAAYATADRKHRVDVVTRAVAGLREAILAGPHSGASEDLIRQRIDAVRDRLRIAA